MSLKAKLEAVIYAADEPVTLTQLAQIFAADALEWKAAEQAAALEMNAEVAGEEQPAADPASLLDESLASLGMTDTAAMMVQAGELAAEAALAEDVSPEAEPGTGAAAEVQPTASSDGPAPVPSEPVDAEAEARHLARQREREVKSILKQILDELIASYASDGRGIEIREIAGGYRMATKPECHDTVRLFVKSLKPPLKLSLPALETLAVVAYKQPVTAPEVSEIRGVEAGGVLGSLLARKLIATAGRKQVIGRPILYKTTKEFLLRFGLKDLTELPSMEEFEKMAAAEIEEMEPEAVAADAAEAAAEAAAQASVADEAAISDQESPSGVEEAETAGTGSHDASASIEAATDETSAVAPESNHAQDGGSSEASGAPPAEPERSAPAETEAVPHGTQGEEGR